MKNRIKGQCTHCETGRKTLELDAHSAMCPYIYSYTKKKCPFYVKLANNKSFLHRILAILFPTKKSRS